VTIQQAGPERSRRGDRAHWIIAVLAVLALAGPVVYWFVGKSEAVPTSGPSMRPTLKGPVSVKVDYDAYEDAGPALGDVVILQGPVLGTGNPCAAVRADASPCPEPARRYGGEYLVKRIVGLPGDEIAIARDGRLIRNGERQAESYARPCRPRDMCALPRPITVPREHYFVAGDNRRNSTDSRDFGPVPLEAVDGRVILEDRAG
jgi:signal peptidase I